MPQPYTQTTCSIYFIRLWIPHILFFCSWPFHFPFLFVEFLNIFKTVSIEHTIRIEQLHVPYYYNVRLQLCALCSTWDHSVLLCLRYFKIAHEHFYETHYYLLGIVKQTKSFFSVDHVRWSQWLFYASPDRALSLI